VKLVAAKNQKFVAEAPVVIAVCSVEQEYIMTCGQPASPIDTAIAVDHMTLQAVEEGIPRPTSRKSMEEIVMREQWKI